ncbi:MAG: ABC transporter substrate-binding protein [Bacteroidota bacterium]|jgi:putative ABC transport system substrate-binding protein
MKISKIPSALVAVMLVVSCGQSNQDDKNIPVVGFLDFIQDSTIDMARKGFYDALRNKGFSEDKKTVRFVYSNAQGDIPTLNQSCDYILSSDPDLIATNVTLSTITASKRTKKVPIFMMVSPRPDLAGLTDRSNKHADNLSGVYETLDYLDSAVVIIKQLYPNAKKIGTVFNQAEPQSQAAYNRIYKKCFDLGMEMVSLPVNNSSESQLVTEALLLKGIDVFFALPDNVIFASFETIDKSCRKANVPIITSEAGLVRRGALASYGADFYLWGYQSGEMAATYLQAEKKSVAPPEIVKIRKKLFNPTTAQAFNIQPDSTFEAYRP